MAGLNFDASRVTPAKEQGDILSEPVLARSWSTFQTSIFAFVASGTGNAIVEAVAGSGKSTTIIEAMKLAKGSLIFLAFNKAIAEELKSKGVPARTFHSLCMAAVMKANPAAVVEGNKMRKIAQEELDADTYRLYGSFAIKMVGLAKQVGMGFLQRADDIQNWTAIADHHGIEPEHEDANLYTGCQTAAFLLKLSNESHMIDFDDMLYVAVRDRLSLPKFDFVFVDEAQDTNMIQREILRMIMRPGARMVAVGDPSQAIYGFRGADARSLHQIAEEFQAVTLPLSISYRCSKSVVTYARQWVDHIQAADNAPEGEVVSHGTKWDPSIFRPDDLVICRKTRPLLALAFKCIRYNIPVQVLGRDIGAGLKSLVYKQRAKSIDQLTIKLGQWRDREVAKAAREENESMIESINDKVESVLFLCESLREDKRTMAGLEQGIDYLFKDKSVALKLCTIHKSKGLEAPRVFWLDRSACPAPYARLPWQQQEERHLCYVAATRAKLELHLLEEDRDERDHKPLTGYNAQYSTESVGEYAQEAIDRDLHAEEQGKYGDLLMPAACLGEEED